MHLRRSRFAIFRDVARSVDRIPPTQFDVRLICSAGSLAKKASTLSIPLASLKFPPITTLSFSSARAKDWDDVITTHADETFVRTWNVLGKKLGKHSLGFVDGTKKKGPVGSAKVRMTSFIATRSDYFLTASVSSGCLRHGMWQLWYRQLING